VNSVISSLSKLPKGWVWTNVSEVASLIRGVSYPKEESSKEAKDGYIPILRANNIAGELNFNELVYVPHKRINDEQLVRVFDILIAMSSGSKDLVGKASQANCDLDGGFGAFCGVVRITPELDRRFVGFFFKSPSYRSEISRLSSGVNINNLRRDHIESMPIPLPPLHEQHRIVDKIEELFTRLDAGVESLKKIKAQLKRYRQSVLKHAFEGKLTEEWRQAHKDELEPASVLLEHIKQERQKTAEGKDLPPPDINDLPGLPEGWSYLTLDFLVPGVRNAIRRGPFGSAIKKAFFVPSGYKVYEQGNVIYNDFDRGSYYIDEKKFEEMKDFEVGPGDILMSCSGTVGKITIAPEGIRPGVINQALLKITLNNKIVDTSYFVYLFRSRVEGIMLANTRGSAMVNVSSVKDLRQIPFPISSVPEQHKIVEEIERHFSVAGQIEKTVDHGLKQAERLRQSILKRAFEGKLVPQDPNDEPAEKLLERIRGQRAKKVAEKRVTVSRVKRRQNMGGN
jgi:type I restriction enzyme S subunit